jgi:hypothetical protein
LKWKGNETRYLLIYHHEWLKRTKTAVYEIIGKICVFCGMGDMDCFNLDHINNDGYADRNSNLTYMYTRIIKDPEKYKKILQTTCASCNIKKRAIRQELIYLEKLGIPPF